MNERPAAFVDEGLGCCITLHVVNHGHIAAAYGEAIADQALVLLQGVMRGVCNAAAGAMSSERRLESLPVAVEMADARDAMFIFVPAAMAGPSFELFASELLAQIAARAIVIHEGGGQPARLRLLAALQWWTAPSFDYGRGRAELKGLEEKAAEGPLRSLAPVPNSERARLAYRLDLAAADDAMRAVFEGGHCLAWQPVVRSPSTDVSARILYFEGLSRFLSESRGFVENGNYLGALERTGFVRALDRMVAADAIAELKTSISGVALGFNISSLSAIDDLWWAPLWAELKRSPSVASRLFVELTGSEPNRSPSLAADFVSRLRRHGGHLVLDRFGASHASIREAVALAPDAIKIPHIFLGGAARAIRDGRCFAPLAQFAAAMGAEVIAQNVENREQMDFAALNGAGWCQGDLPAPPSLLRPWVLDGGSTGAGVSEALSDRLRPDFSARGASGGSA
ncbi:EAL domain-containing protein [Sphingopyxis sp. LARHCG72]